MVQFMQGHTDLVTKLLVLLSSGQLQISDV